MPAEKEYIVYPFAFYCWLFAFTVINLICVPFFIIVGSKVFILMAIWFLFNYYLILSSSQITINAKDLAIKRIFRQEALYNKTTIVSVQRVFGPLYKIAFNDGKNYHFFYPGQDYLGFKNYAGEILEKARKH